MIGVQILLLAFFIGSAFTLRENFVRIGKYDYLVSEQKLNWFRAAHYCHSIDADLASIESSAELLAISGYLKGKGKGSEDWFWFDGNELGEHGQWYSLTTGRLMAFIQWTKTEPNMLDNAEHCICLWKEVNEFEMSDWGCENPAYFICKARPQVETLGKNRTKIAAGAGADTFSSLKEQLDKERKVNFTEIEDQFYFIGDTAVSWHEADQLCRRHDANLANIESHSELAAIGKFLLKKGDWAFWIDGIDAERKGVIISLTNGKPLSFMDFDSWQPYRGLGNCVMIWSYDGIFKMYENSCESKALYVCKAKEPEVVIVYGSPVGFLE